MPLQHCLSLEQKLSFARHIGVVDVEVVGVVVDVEVVLVGVVVEVLVEVLVVLLVVLLVVEVVLLVDVLVEVVVVVTHGPVWSPWPWWLTTALWATSMVFSSGVPGLWQMVTFCC
jgi:hypothetical protein